VLALRVVAAGSSFLMYVALARALGVEEYGLFIYVLTWLNVLLLAGRFGMDLTILRYLPGYVESGNWARARGILRFAHAMVLGATLSLGAAGIVVALGLGRSGPVSAVFVAGLLSLPLLALSVVRQSTLRALHAFVLAEIPDGLLRPWLLVVAVWAAWAFSAPVSARDAMLCYLAVNAATLAVGTFWLLRVLPPLLRDGRSEADRRAWLVVSAQLLVHSGIFQLVNQIDVLMLGAFAGPEDVGRYSAASRMAWFVSFGTVAMSSIAAPLVSAHFSRQDMVGLQSVVKSATRRGFAFAVVVSLALAILGTLVLSFFGPEFRSAYPALLVLLAGQLVNAFWGLGSYVMIMMDRQWPLVAIMVAALGLAVVLNTLLIPPWGFMGAASATAITVVAWSGAVFVYCWKVLRIRGCAL
jgi:O-antigen/teichoic acid export membrane protein